MRCSFVFSLFLVGFGLMACGSVESTDGGASSGENGLSAIPNILTFSGVNPGNSDGPETVVLRNTEDRTIEQLAVTVAGDLEHFFFDFAECEGTSLGSLETCSVDITYSPKVSGQTEHQTMVRVNDVNDEKVFTMFTVRGSSANPVSLTVEKNGTGFGDIDRDIAGTSCGNDCQEYSSGTVVTLTTTPWAGSEFEGWSGGCSGSSSICVVTLDADTQVFASFRSIASHEVVVRSLSALGGRISIFSDPMCQQEISCVRTLNEGESILVTASVTDPSWTFSRWAVSSDASLCQSGSNSCRVTVTGATNISASFNFDP